MSVMESSISILVTQQMSALSSGRIAQKIIPGYEISLIGKSYGENVMQSTLVF